MSGTLPPAGGAAAAPAEAAVKPWERPATAGVIALCVAAWALLNLGRFIPALRAAESLLVPSSYEVWQGAYHGLLLSSFLHIDAWHIAFNMLAAWEFGKKIEPVLGSRAYLAFIAVSGAVSTGMELLCAQNMSIGLSGSLYAVLGLAWMGKDADERLREIAKPSTLRIALGWLVLCFFLTAFEVVPVGNAAHVGGLLFGCLCAYPIILKRRERESAAALALMGVLTALSITYMPWSERWRERDVLRTVADLMRRAGQGDHDAEAAWGGALVHVPGRREEGLRLLRKSAEAGNTNGMNALAWLHATGDDGLRDGRQAVAWAERAVAADGRKAANYIDTLAAAYAEVGRWPDAVRTQRDAITALKASDAPSAPGYQERLVLYRSKKPYRER